MNQNQDGLMQQMANNFGNCMAHGAQDRMPCATCEADELAFAADIRRDALEIAANACREIIGDASHPNFASGAAECMIAIRKIADAK